MPIQLTRRGYGARFTTKAPDIGPTSQSVPVKSVNRPAPPFVTAAEPGSGAVNVKGPVPDAGSCQLTWARPSAPVVTGVVPMIVPLPSPTANVTVAPAIGVPPESFTTTDGTTLLPGDPMKVTAPLALST